MTKYFSWRCLTQWLFSYLDVNRSLILWYVLLLFQAQKFYMYSVFFLFHCNRIRCSVFIRTWIRHFFQIHEETRILRILYQHSCWYHLLQKLDIHFADRVRSQGCQTSLIFEVINFTEQMHLYVPKIVCKLASLGRRPFQQ